MGTACLRLIGQVQHEDRAAFLTVEAEIFVQRHRLYPYGRHRSHHALWINFIKSGQFVEIQRGIEASFFGFRGSKTGQDSFNPLARAMGAACRRLIGQAQYKDGAALLTVEAAVFV